MREMTVNRNRMLQELTKEALTRLYLNENKSCRAIAKITGCSYSSVVRRCRRYGILLRTSRHEKIKIDRAVLRKLYVEERKTVDEIAAILSCNPTTILRRLYKYKIPVRRNRREGLTKQLIQKLYVKEHRSTREIGKLCGCSRTAVQNRCREYGIPLRNPGGNQRIEINEEMLRTWYVKDGRSVEQIAKKVGCSYRTIFTRVKRLGLHKHKKGS